MAECVIFVEGGRNTDNGDLRNGFGRLVRQASLRRMPRIIMCNDTNGAIRLFRLEAAKPNSAFQQILLLVDLDGPADTREAWLNEKDLTAYGEQVFFMVQKMEAWFLAQPAVVHDFYGPKLTHTLPPTAAALVPHPDQVLERCTTDTRKGRYHKIRHGAQLLPLLKLADLQSTFPDVARLMTTLTA